MVEISIQILENGSGVKTFKSRYDLKSMISHELRWYRGIISSLIYDFLFLRRIQWKNIILVQQ